MPSCDGFSEGVRQRVEHAVVRVHGGQTVLLELFGYDGHQTLHPVFIVGPVTYNLHDEEKRIIFIRTSL